MCMLTELIHTAMMMTTITRIKTTTHIPSCAGIHSLQALHYVQQPVPHGLYGQQMAGS
jgi:hypothetical protein